MRTVLRISLFLLGCLCTWLACSYYHLQIISKIENANMIVISKQDMRLHLIDYKGDTLFCAPVAVGKAYGNKQKQGDMRTPEGVFQVVDIQNASRWKHDFHDGKGEIEGAYGNYFIRLNVPGHKGIGIHGTHAPESIGSRATEGCIRLKNDDLERLVGLIYPPLTVVVTPSVMDERQNLKNRE
ncbi:MAG: L,D-transpeptidase [Bacteroidaceae bacterium]